MIEEGFNFGGVSSEDFSNFFGILIAEVKVQKLFTVGLKSESLRWCKL